ncbi:unnamed protein product [Parnassius mnemosyne]
MGPLPASRIRPARPFLKTAVDYAGPFFVRANKSSKWLHDRGSAIREGTVVVVCDEHLPPLQWKLARVHAVHPGSDQVTRVVTLKAGNTIFKRPVVKICPLPLE